MAQGSSGASSAQSRLAMITQRRKPTYSEIRAARLQQAGGRYTPQQWKHLVEWFDGRCVCCGEAKPLTVDHVQPVALGGTNWLHNLQPLCHTCNRTKNDRAIDYRDPIRLTAFFAYYGYYRPRI